ncbi:MAG: GNAT family N-acetyltransferase [Lachnospiraceae bacterium]|nr:GNAT family N-acetyltransferase [Lachnospiraceae bacterium]
MQEINLFEITNDNLNYFEPLLTEESANLIKEDLAIGVGITADDRTIAALVCSSGDQPEDVRIYSIYVAHDFRRMGCGTEMLSYMANMLLPIDTITRITCAFCVREDDPDTKTLRPFFDYLGFSTEELETACFTCKVGDLMTNKIFAEKQSSSCVPFGSLKTRERKLLLFEPANLKPLIDEGEIDPDVSFCHLSGDKITGCVLLSHDSNTLTFEWGRTSPNNPALFIVLLREALYAAAEKYGSDTDIAIPAVNRQSIELARKILGEHALETEHEYQSTLYFREEEN